MYINNSCFNIYLYITVVHTCTNTYMYIECIFTYTIQVMDRWRETNMSWVYKMKANTPIIFVPKLPMYLYSDVYTVRNTNSNNMFLVHDSMHLV